MNHTAILSSPNLVVNFLYDRICPEALTKNVIQPAFGVRISLVANPIASCSPAK